jgi:glucose-1-phosphate thymidylyltransferase
LDNNIKNGGEYQINDGIKAMANGKISKTGSVDEWMDWWKQERYCGKPILECLGFLYNDGKTFEGLWSKV